MEDGSVEASFVNIGADASMTYYQGGPEITECWTREVAGASGRVTGISVFFPEMGSRIEVPRRLGELLPYR